MILKRLAKIFCGFLLLVILWQPAGAVESAEQKITNLIKDQVVTGYPAWKNLKIEVAYKFTDNIFKQLDAQGYDLGFKITETSREIKPLGNVIFPIEVSLKETTQKIFIRARVGVFNNLVVAKNTVKRGESLSSENLAVEERDIATLPQQYYSNINDLKNKEAKITIPSNSTVFDWMVKNVPLVRRGENVTIRVTAPNLLVKSSGVFLEDGYLNEKVRVRKNGSKDILEGILKSTGEVEVRLR
ncbi:flagella basal body P-ring formation protein FlgA [candidate division WOR-1 bacterium RIFOXYB2_FULL_42_35]|uniref:Flagella basal body P-ring formation protein FlgA n=1 Tax=candidate division WOR-1 bacterium RIFOXYC2_FULL_41_25 TaxID=1802586 RepID=A0A1F4TKG5_UNCSA|nr:MAG: flagella basal body P-ring formation protein FlgA [candidate division WOR-1 bacterium RIFOXYA2_FULL_41_14]OGC22480.1 MAG: flagella basal body P-ring formation protein FlgA [candidate division WOR-1 bacterium RIFOXYB2_FULL_42_35]OGC33218.1 MAG: flagella basal body P-ring formation protein FlgA [candidate division WOR-1 bacterium RIFOXYC2_FULL_41_25]OGC43496.1 MAG: flagella basal body P-ring formation protein FlgA [candidate division WOR-1 bacterium RIFOXYD2_FULL_41_8]